MNESWISETETPASVRGAAELPEARLLLASGLPWTEEWISPGLLTDGGDGGKGLLLTGNGKGSGLSFSVKTQMRP